MAVQLLLVSKVNFVLSHVHLINKYFSDESYKNLDDIVYFDSNDDYVTVKLMNNIGHYILSNSNFADVQSFTLQDDASETVRNQNVESIKTFIKKSNQDGKRVLMVSNLMSGKGIQKNIESDFAGFNYTFNSKGLLVHPLFKEWIAESIRSQ